jgi:hemerythrin-like domain-containing protein
MSRRATAVLRDEHQLILRVAAAFEALLDSAGPAGPDAGDAADCITFFRLYTDACHHGKEEDLLFAALEEHGVAGDDGPVAAMREEHRYGRELVGRMAAAVELLGAGAADAPAALRRDGADYIDFIRGHIRREDDGLFDLADDIVDGSACTALCSAYDTVCARRFEGRSMAELERLAEQLIERYPAR